MYVGYIVLGVFIVLVIAGFMQRLSKRWGIRESIALLVALLVFGGALIEPINIDNAVVFSIGGFLIPLLASIVLFWGLQSFEIARTIIAIVVIGVVSALLTNFFPIDNNLTFIDAGLFIGLVAGGFAFLICRSNRGALISCLLGVLSSNIFLFLYNMISGVTTMLVIGTDGQFSAVIVAVFAVVVMVELAGIYLKEKDKRLGGEDDYFNEA